uniref:Uncharacterized protein n=1 Tax=Picea glauca TaxID=3330 RepID=A0A117NG08_PICGL|nr:hypothetical protein ABT39_MTgene2131 [Picea glauca]
MGSAPLSAPFTLALTFRLHSILRIYLYAALLPFLQAYSFVCMRAPTGAVRYLLVSCSPMASLFRLSL